MKSKLLLFLALSALCSAAVAPVVTDTLMRIQCDPDSGKAQAFFQKTITMDTQEYAQPWEEVQWTTGSTRTVTYTYGGQSYTQPYAQVMAAVVAIANQERTSPSP